MLQPIFFECKTLLIPPVVYSITIFYFLFKLRECGRKSVKFAEIIVCNLLLIYSFFFNTHSLRILILKLFIFTLPLFYTLYKNISLNYRGINKKIDSIWLYSTISITIIVVLCDLITRIVGLKEMIIFNIYMMLFILSIMLISFYLLFYRGVKDLKSSNSIYRVKSISLTSINIIVCVIVELLALLFRVPYLLYFILILLYLSVHLFMLAYSALDKGERDVLYNHLFFRQDTLNDGAGYASHREKLDAEILTRLVYLFEYDKPYLNKEISINTIAADIYTNRTYLSNALNSRTTKNFSEFVNYYRVKESCSMFIDSPALDMQEVFELCGFNNFSSANNAFKSHLGVTPGEWAKNVRSKMKSNEEVRVSDYIV